MPVALERLSESAELLFRQANQGWLREGRPSAQLFRPRPKDKGRVSVDRQSLIGSAAASRDRAIANGYPSAGAWAVSVGEVNGQDLQAYGAPSARNDAHAVIDMAGSKSAEQGAKADRLHHFALLRGQLA